MDNDNPLLQKAADLYRGLRFTMKYRGVDILPAAAGNDLARDLLESGQPFLFGRCGATEMRTVADWLQNGGHNFTDRTRADIRNLSGVFPTDDATLDKFCRLYVKTAQSAELLALWNVGAEREVIRGCDATRFTELRALEPYYHARPWSAALAGKRVLVVHPFRRTILAQYEKRTQLFPGKDVLPELASLTVIQAVRDGAPDGRRRLRRRHRRRRGLQPAAGRPRPRHRPRRHTNERCYAAFVWHQGQALGRPPRHFQALQPRLGPSRRDRGHQQ